MYSCQRPLGNNFFVSGSILTVLRTAISVQKILLLISGCRETLELIVGMISRVTYMKALSVFSLRHLLTGEIATASKINL